MSEYEVYIDVEVDDSQLQEFFDYAGYKIRDMREPLGEVLHEIIFRNIEEQFDTSGSLSGGWEPLSENYRLRKEANPLYSGMGMLERTGEMRAYLEGMFPEKPYHLTRSYLFFDPHHIDRVGWHQHGVDFRKPGGRLPEREILVWQQIDNIEAGHIFEDWLDDLRSWNARRSGSAVRPNPVPNIIDFVL